MIGGAFLASGRTASEVHVAREHVRRRIAFYASTRAYAPVLEHHGWDDLGPRLRELIARGAWDHLGESIDDTIQDAFCIAGTYEELPPRVGARLGSLVDRVSLAMPENAASDAPYLQATIAALRQLPTARDRRKSALQP